MYKAVAYEKGSKLGEMIELPKMVEERWFWVVVKLRSGEGYTMEMISSWNMN